VLAEWFMAGETTINRIPEVMDFHLSFQFLRMGQLKSTDGMTVETGNQLR
jgi:hypothetical protein